MNLPKYLGEGSYGCVHSPPLKCKGEEISNNPNMLSKILTNKNAEIELNEISFFSKLDPNNDYHLGKPKLCVADKDSAINRKAIGKCENQEKFNAKNLMKEKYTLLLMKNGGKSLTDFTEKMNKLVVNIENKRKVEMFWIEVMKLFNLFVILKTQNVLHYDIKCDNLLYDEATNRINVIDFGSLTKKDKIIKKAVKSDLWQSIYYFAWPPETIMYNKNLFLSTLKKRNVNEVVEEAMIKAKITQKIPKYSLNYFLSLTNSGRNKNAYSDYLNELYRFLLSIDANEENYKKLLGASIETFDSYGLGVALLACLHKTEKFISPLLHNNLLKLFQRMISINPFHRGSQEENLLIYKKCLMLEGLVDNVHMPSQIITSRTKTPTRPSSIKCKKGFTRNNKNVCVRNKTKKQK